MLAFVCSVICQIEYISGQGIAVKIKEVKLKRFKRFTDLKLTGIPETAKLIVLVGPNGSGKTSFFVTGQAIGKKRTYFQYVVSQYFYKKSNRAAR